MTHLAPHNAVSQSSEYLIRDAAFAEAGEMAGVIADAREQTYGLYPGSWEYRTMIDNWRGSVGAMTMHGYLSGTGEWAQPGPLPRARVITRAGDAAILGVMATREEHVHGQPGVELDMIFVDPHEQGKGLGSRLMDDLTDYAGGRPQSLSVIYDNTRAQRLYERYGFRPAGTSGYAPLRFLKMIKPAGQH